MWFRWFLMSCLFAAGLGLPAVAAEPETTSPEDTLYLDLDAGRAVIRMRPDLAPKHVARIKHLVRGGFYDGMVFHRVIDGFMAQTGDPKSDGTGGSGRNLEAEFTRTGHVRGTVSMARTSARNSADSQWFIVLSDANRSSLDGQYTVWGEVTSGMEFVDKIKKGNTNRNGAVTNPDKIVRMRVAADDDRQGQAPAPTSATAREFNGTEFRCAMLGESVDQAALAPAWAHGYLAGAYKAQNKLTFAGGSESAVDISIQEICKSMPQAFLVSAIDQGLAGTPRDLPAATAVFSPSTYTCKDYVAARDGANKDDADAAEMWGFAFMQGFKAINQPGLGMPFAAKAQLLGAVAANCAKNPEVTFANLAALVAEKVKLK